MSGENWFEEHWALLPAHLQDGPTGYSSEVAARFAHVYNPAKTGLPEGLVLPTIPKSEEVLDSFGNPVGEPFLDLGPGCLPALINLIITDDHAPVPFDPPAEFDTFFFDID